MIDDHRVRQMAREYDMNYSTARQLLEGARDVPALRIGRRYRKMMGGDAGGNIEGYSGTVLRDAGGNQGPPGSD